MESMEKEELAHSAIQFQLGLVTTALTATDVIKVCRIHKVRYIDDPTKVHLWLDRFNTVNTCDALVKLKDIANFAIYKISNGGKEVGGCSKCLSDFG